MKKTFTILSVRHKVLAKKKGLMIWQLRDENNQLRKVEAFTILDKNEFIKGFKAIHAREVLLVEELNHHVEGATFEIDFTHFNEAQGYLKREAFANMQQREKINELSNRVTRILLMTSFIVLVALCWQAYTAITSFTHSVHPFSIIP